MISFVLDGSHRRVSLALFEGENLIYDVSMLSRSLHSKFLIDVVDFAFRSCGISVEDIGSVYCGIGPGRYTSLRVSVAFVKGLFFGKDVNVYAVNSLDLIAAGVFKVFDELCVFSEVYSGYVKYRKYRLMDGVYIFCDGGRIKLEGVKKMECFCVSADERVGVHVDYPEARNIVNVDRSGVIRVKLETLKPEY